MFKVLETISWTWYVQNVLQKVSSLIITNEIIVPVCLLYSDQLMVPIYLCCHFSKTRKDQYDMALYIYRRDWRAALCVTVLNIVWPKLEKSYNLRYIKMADLSDFTVCIPLSFHVESYFGKSIVTGSVGVFTKHIGTSITQYSCNVTVSNGRDDFDHQKSVCESL